MNLRHGLWASLLLLPGCASLPSLDGRAESHALPPASNGRLVQILQPQTTAHPGLTGIYTLGSGRSAFAARAALAETAQQSLDVQYYIWHYDLSGALLFDELRRAADRGVRVRLLLDDNNTAGMDDILLALDAHPNLELRLYNPFPKRSMRPLCYLTEFSRLNRRMHNKSMTADNVATVIGGRNVGNEYFGASGDVEFADLDLLAVGEVVPEVSGSFDQYWNSASAYPAATVAKGDPAGDAKALLQAKIAELGGEAAVQKYRDALLESTFATDALRDGFARGTLPYEWVQTRTVADDPSKTLGAKDGEDPRMLPRLKAAVGPPASSLDVVSPYFVPGESGTTAFTTLARSGVNVRVLTNSLSATDVAPVHSGYMKRRKDLLEAGVKLYELKRTGAPESKSSDFVHKLGGSAASLHAKTFAVDGDRVFVGSFNFDPRSAELNTELGFVVWSRPLAQRLQAAFDQTIPQLAYEVRLDSKGHLQWVDPAGAEPVVHETEPETGAFKRGLVRVVSWLPIDWML